MKTENSKSKTAQSEKFISKESSLARWSIPASILFFLGLILSMFFLPAGIVLAVIGAIVIGAIVLQRETVSEA